DYLESAAEISQRLYEKLRRAKQGGGLAMPAAQGSARLRVPHLPWLRGVGPIAWRQLILALRTSRHAVLTSLIVCGVFLTLTLFPPRGSVGAEIVPGGCIGVLAYLTYLFAMQLPWAFRGDIDYMDWLKSLPVQPLALVLGELIGGAAVLTAIQLSII